MVRLAKSKLPEGVTIRSRRDYRSDPVYTLIKSDCYGKCYICEDGSTTKINVEHRIPHRGDPALEFSWDNLFFSCAHCNGTKNANFPNIIDCTKRDPEELIELRIDPYPGRKVIVHCLVDDDEEAHQTAELLDRVYNGEKTPIASDECCNLREKLQDDLMKFQALLWRYSKQHFDEEETREQIREDIAREVSRRSAFSAFKRLIIRDTPKFADLFSESVLNK